MRDNQENQERRRLREIQRADKKGLPGYTIELAKRFLADFPDFSTAWLYYAEPLYAIARYAEALSALRQALRLMPKDKLYLAYARLGHLYYRKGDLSRAVSWYRKAIAMRPFTARYHIFLGAVLARAGRLKEAEAVHRRATRCKDGPIDEAYFNLGLVLRAQARYKEALKCFEKALQLDPRDKQTRKNIIDVQHVLKLQSGSRFRSASRRVSG